MTTHSLFLVRKISWTEEPGTLWSMGSQRVRHDLSDRLCMHAVNYITRVVQHSQKKKKKARIKAKKKIIYALSNPELF